MNYLQLKDSVCQLAKETAEFIARERENFDPSRIEHKGHQNLVSYIDKAAEEMIVEGLSKLIEGCDFLGEEGTQTDNGSPYRWIIDPLDGTTNFIHNFPPYCVSIALEHNGVIVLGVVYIVSSGECFAATIDSRSTLNGKEISVSEVSAIEDSLVISGLAYDHSSDIIDDFTKLFDHFNRTTNGARRLGSAAANLAYVAAGRAECFYQRSLAPWDVAAGALIVQRAGGEVTDFSGGNDFVFGRSLIATNGILHCKFSETINR